jgi:hypothetical protein
VISTVCHGLANSLDSLFVSCEFGSKNTNDFIIFLKGAVFSFDFTFFAEHKTVFAIGVAVFAEALTKVKLEIHLHYYILNAHIAESKALAQINMSGKTSRKEYCQ